MSEAKYDLSIVVLTMNRKDQVLEALESCFAARLPEKVEFVVVDNHSTDGTGDAIRALMQERGIRDFQYEYEEENLGVGGGRARAFEMARGKYMYVLDDDAVIAADCADRFFIEPFEYLEKNRNVASITTRIKDLLLEYDREVDQAPTQVDGRNVVFKFLGGSHFLRKEAFESPLYFSIKYGGEEFAPSIIAQDAGYCHVYFDDVYIIHKPKKNKWVAGTEDMERVLCCGISVAHATKLILYPTIFRPILALAYRRRLRKHMAAYPGAKKKCDEMIKTIRRENKRKKVKISTVIALYRKFGLTTF